MAFTVSELRAQDPLIVKLSLRITDFSFETQDGYDVIIPKRERMGQISIPGHPQLPTWFPRYIIPWWKDIAYCEIVALDSVQIPGTWHIYPAQMTGPVGDSMDWTPPDSAIYNSDSLYPGKFQNPPGSGAFDGARITALSLYPIQYRPKSGRLFLYTEATLKLFFKDSEPPINAKQRYAHVQETYDQMLSALVENDGDIGAWYRRPAVIDPNGGKPYGLPPAFIIVTTANQAQYAQPYADWITQKGFPTDITDIGWILSNYSGVDAAEKLRNFVIDKFADEGAAYFLFLGHEDDVPYRLLGPVASGLSPYPNDYWYRLGIMPSDLYFSEVDTNVDWDTNDDGYYGVYDPDSSIYKYLDGPPPDTLEPEDVIPEVFVGRILAKDTTEVQNWVLKALNYEKSPGNASGMKNVLHSSDAADSQQVDTLINHYPGDFHHFVTNSSGATKDSLNTYYYGWVNTISHGRWNESWVLQWQQDTIPADRFFSSPRWSPFNINDLSDLTNQNAYFIHYSIACVQTCYDDYIDPYDPAATPVTDTSIGEGFVEAYPARGAVASFTNTRLGLNFGSNTIQNRFLDAIFDNGVWFTGAAFTQAKATDPTGEGDGYLGFYSRYTVNEFGSPITEAWTDIPKTTKDTASPMQITVGVPTNITVTVRYWSGSSWVLLSGARVTLYGCGVYKLGITNSRGYYTFTGVTADSTGTIAATASKHNYKPSFKYITVTSKGTELAQDENLPQEFFMSLASSNPVKGNLKLQYGIPLEDEGPVSLKIYDVSGRVVQTVFSEEKNAGFYEVSIPTGSFLAGAYFIRLETARKARTEKMIKGGE